MFVYNFVHISHLSNFSCKVHSFIHNKDNLCITILTGKGVKPRSMVAQQHYYMITTNEGIITSSFGSFTSDKQLSGGSTQPRVTLEGNRLTVKYGYNLTLRGFNVRDKMNLIMDGFNTIREEKYKKYIKYTIQTLGFMITINKTNRKLVITWNKINK